jgi:outer membrane protein TolC
MLGRFVCLGLLLTAATVLAAPAPAAKDAPKLDAATLAKIRKLQIDRRDTLKKEVRAREQEFQAGRGTLDVVLKAARKLLQAELDLAATLDERIEAHAAYLKVVKEVDKQTTALYEAGRVKAADHYQARAARLEAEIGWLKAGGKEKK